MSAEWTRPHAGDGQTPASESFDGVLTRRQALRYASGLGVAIGLPTVLGACGSSTLSSHSQAAASEQQHLWRPWKHDGRRGYVGALRTAGPVRSHQVGDRNGDILRDGPRDGGAPRVLADGCAEAVLGAIMAPARPRYLCLPTSA